VLAPSYPSSTSFVPKLLEEGIRHVPITHYLSANVANKVKQATGDAVQGEPSASAAELRGEAKGKAAELKGEVKGAAHQAAGKVKGAADRAQKNM
jgi:uncharacterized protein YjbJ (UPF0337 family)